MLLYWRLFVEMFGFAALQRNMTGVVAVDVTG